MSFKSDIKSLILAALQDGPKHGYLIAKTIKRASQSVLKVGESAIYPALQELEESGAILSEWEPQVGKPSRKVYAITPTGRAEFKTSLEEWSKFASAVNAVLSPASNGGAKAPQPVPGSGPVEALKSYFHANPSVKSGLERTS